jgi:hypothetical protein
MSSASNQARKARIAEVSQKIQEEIESLRVTEDLYLDKAFRFKQEAIAHHRAGRVEDAKTSLVKKIQYEKLADNIANRISRLMDNSMKLDGTNHKLFIRSLPESLVRDSGVKNLYPNLNVNNNTLERLYSKKYGFENYNLPPVAASDAEENAPDTNGVCDKLGRCVRMARNGVFHFFTRKNNTKKEGGAKKGKKGKKGKSMKRSRRN